MTRVGMKHQRTGPQFKKSIADQNEHRSMIYVDGDATMDTYQDAEGKTRKSLSIIQRMIFTHSTTISEPNFIMQATMKFSSPPATEPLHLDLSTSSTILTP